MLVTEEEARTMWCPFSRVVVGSLGDRAPAFNRGQSKSGTVIPDGANCIASRCAAWRDVPEPSPYGYCGLAGDPRPRLMRAGPNGMIEVVG